MKQPQFPDRIVLGEGYPWANGIHPEHFELTIRHQRMGGINLPLDFPKILWSEFVPKYRVVLERVE